jgi:hypothetical protein
MLQQPSPLTPELIITWDQVSPTLILDRGKTRETQEEMIGASDKRQTTAVFCGSLLRNVPPVQLIYKERHPTVNFDSPSDWHITHSLKHWLTELPMLQYILYREGATHGRRRQGCSCNNG